MRINFSDQLSDVLPAFEEIRTFVSAGAVMNIFLLDPIRGLLASFVWLRSTNTIGLYVMPDWSEDVYVFVDTGLQCVSYLSAMLPLAMYSPDHRACTAFGRAFLTTTTSLYTTRTGLSLANTSTRYPTSSSSHRPLPHRNAPLSLARCLRIIPSSARSSTRNFHSPPTNHPFQPR